jgi:hypothetical protein
MGRCLPWSKEEEGAYIFWMKQVPVRCRLMYIQYINLLDKSFRVNNVFLDEQEQFTVA